MTKKNKQIENEIKIEGLEALENEVNQNNDALETLENGVYQDIESNENEWLFDIKPDSMKRALEAGVIFPNFKPYKNTVYKVKVISKPRKVIFKDNQFFTIDIEKDGMRFSMNMNNSFRFQLAMILERYKLTINELIGKYIFLSKDDIGYFNLQFSM